MLSKRAVGGAMAAAAFAVPVTTTAAQAAELERAIDDRTAARELADPFTQRFIGADVSRSSSTRDGGLVLRLKKTKRGFEPAGQLDPRDILADGDRRLARTSSTGPVAHAACPLCIGVGIAVSAAARAAAVRAAGSAGAAAAARSAARSTLPLIRAGAARNFPRLHFPRQRLEAKFKHARDFGVVEQRGAAGFAAFERALKRHMLDPGTHRIFGTIKGKNGLNVHAVHFYNPLTRKVATFTPEGRFWTAYYIQSDFQATRLAAFGHLGKVGRWS